MSTDAPGHADPQSKVHLVRQLFLEALERPADDRASLLASRCAGDPDLRREVEVLLAHAALAPSEFLGSGGASFLKPVFPSFSLERAFLSSSPPPLSHARSESGGRFGPEVHR